MYDTEKQIFTFKKLETGKRNAKLLLFDIDLLFLPVN